MPGIGNELTPKFVKTHHISTSVNAVVALRWLHKLMYEFWGFCVNGTNSLTVPGGFAPLSGVIMPTGFESGSNVLLASGSDGQTVVGQPFFQASSINWTSGSGAYVGKHLVTWKSSSLSTDDSIYLITQIVNSSTIRVNVNNGGTAYTGSLKPAFDTRASINFRVVDFFSASFLSGYSLNDDGMVMHLSAAYLINSGQVTPQFRTRIKTTGNNKPTIALTLSPSGTWTPASSSGFFVDPTQEVSASSATGWGALTGSGYVTLIGAQDFLMCHWRGDWNTAASGFHVEVPQRLYPQGNDPSPLLAMVFGQQGLTTTSTTANYGGGITMHHPPDGTTRSWRTMIRSPTGDQFHSNVFTSNVPNNLSNGRYNEMFFNVYTNKVMMFEMVLGLPSVTNQYSSLRAKVRRARWTAKSVPRLQRIGDSGEWFHAHNGILWPWDNSVLPYDVFFGGT